MNPLVIFCSAMAGGLVSGFIVLVFGYFGTDGSRALGRGRKRGKYTEVSPTMIRKDGYNVGKTRRP